MDNPILDVVIGLLLIYAVTALLVTSLQELVVGNFLRSRVTVMHRLLEEAVGRDAELKKRLLDNPLVFALSTSDEAKKGVVLLRRSSGPSAIPPDVFARALLIEIDPQPGGKPPSEVHATPQQFVDALVAKKLDQPPAASERVVRVLRGLLPGRESDWPAFEAAVAAWFMHVGDRSEGWYKRRSTWASLFVTLLLVGVLNLDSLNIARALSGDAELRTGLANLAERVNAERQAGGTPDRTAATKSADIDKPEVRVSARLVDAYNRLRPLYFQDDAITGFRHQLGTVGKACKLVVRDNDPRVKPRVTGKYVSDADAWVEIIPALLPAVELAAVGRKRDEQDLGEPEPAVVLGAAHTCVTEMSAWVRAAITASKDVATQNAMLEAAKALEDSKAALLALMRQHQVPRSLKRLFQQAPGEFEACAKEASHLDGVRACMNGSLDAMTRLPLAWTEYNLLSQFCRVKSAETLAGLQGLDTGPGGVCGARQEERASIGLKALALESKGGWALAGVALGYAITTMFVLLGAPFWFDLLSKAVNVRAAGRRRDEDDNAAKAGGTLPLLSPSKAGASALASPATTSTGTPADPALNGFESQLTRREIVALQQRLGVVPASGVLDDSTRLKLDQVSKDSGLGGGKQLTPAVYLALVGRPALAGQSPVIGSLARPVLREPYAAAAALADNLEAMLDFSGRVARPASRFDDELRALGVLYRYKQLPPASRDPVSTPGAAFFALAVNAPKQLDELDEGLLNDILASRTRKTPDWDRYAGAPWLDWAIGELGQVENKANSRKASNPRICEYLDALTPKLGDQGDNTAWCGAFTTWVIKRYNEEQARRPALGPALPAPVAGGAGAAAWLTWRPTGQPPVIGNLVAVPSAESNSGFHVGWCVGVTPTHVYLLGGNQTGGSRVSVSRFDLAGAVANR